MITIPPDAARHRAILGSMRSSFAPILAAALASTACSSRLAPVDTPGDASLAEASRTDAAPAASDAGVPVDACDPPAPPPPTVDAGAVLCTSPLGRTCVGPGPCECDDTCNECACTDAGAWSTTDVACNGLGSQERCLGPTTSSCRATPFPHNCTTKREFYCAPWVTASCGSGVCPALDCTLHHRDGQGGSIWCCP